MHHFNYFSYRPIARLFIHLNIIIQISHSSKFLAYLTSLSFKKSVDHNDMLTNAMAMPMPWLYALFKLKWGEKQILRREAYLRFPTRSAMPMARVLMEVYREKRAKYFIGPAWTRTHRLKIPQPSALTIIPRTSHCVIWSSPWH